MIGIVLVTHGRLAEEFLKALEHVIGPQLQVETVSIDPQDDMEARRADILSAIRRTDTGEGVALLTDMFGGTPSNLAISTMTARHVEVLAGMNLPMLVKLASARAAGADLAAAVGEAEEAGRRYISMASRVLGQKGS